MKTKQLFIIATSIGLFGVAHAEEGKPQRPERKMPPEMLKKFDKDGDGKLNEEERAAAKAAREEMMKAHKAEMLKKFDKDGDGKLSAEEEAAMKEERKKMMMERFDKDKDGVLSDEEKAEMRKAMMDRPGPHREGDKQQQTRDGKGKGKGKGQGGGEAPGVTE
jgi:Ca2+-binding EF-hand superfamily protein